MNLSAYWEEGNVFFPPLNGNLTDRTYFNHLYTRLFLNNCIAIYGDTLNVNCANFKFVVTVPLNGKHFIKNNFLSEET